MRSAGLFFGGLFMTIPVIGHIIVLGYLAAMAVSTPAATEVQAYADAPRGLQ